MPDAMTIDQFQPHEGDTFLVYTGIEGAPPVPMQLAKVTSYRSDADAGNRQSFALLFIQPERINLPQRIYRMEHPTLEPLDIFIVPIGPDSRGMQYEAIFT